MPPKAAAVFHLLWRPFRKGLVRLAIPEIMPHFSPGMDFVPASIQQLFAHLVVARMHQPLCALFEVVSWVCCEMQQHKVSSQVHCHRHIAGVVGNAASTRQHQLANEALFAPVIELLQEVMRTAQNRTRLGAEWLIMLHRR